MSDQTTLEVVLSSESTVGNPIIETVTVTGTVPIGPRGIDGTDGTDGVDGTDGEGVPTGGTAGQILTKDSGTDFDTSWQDPAAVSGVVETIVAGSNIDVDATDPANPIVSVEALVDADIPASIARDSEVTAAVAAEAALARNADNLTSGTVADARIASTIARDSEVSAAITASEAGQVRDGDAAGGVLSGTYPNPGFAADMATQAELDAHVNDTADAHDASAISIADAGNDFTATDVEGALAELQADHEADSTALADHLADTSDAHDASAISVADAGGHFTGTDVEAVLQELGDGGVTTAEIEEIARDALGAALVAGTNITITPNDGADTITIDAAGGSSYTDENAQDAVGTILADSATIDFTYTDATPEITAVVKDGSITAAKVAADVATQAELDAVAGTIPNTEAIQDVVGGMVSGGTETGIAVSYDDTNGRLDFVAEVTQAELDAKADDSAVVHDTGDETVAGVKTFSSDPLIPDEAYDATAWNGVLEPPTKNAVRDKIEDILDGVTFSGDIIVPAEAYGTGWNGSNEAPTKNDVYDQMELKAPLAVVGAKAWRSAAWTITGSAGTPVTIPFDSEVFDSGSIHNASTGEFTAPSAGLYTALSRISITSASNTERFIYSVFVNGTETIRGSDSTYLTGMNNFTLFIVGDLSLAANDVVTFKINQINGTLRILEVGNQRNSFASLRKIGT